MIGAVVHGSDLEELADNINVDSKILADTVSKWNHSVSSKTDALFNRSTGMNTLLNASPYYAIHIAPAVHYTMGGVKINHKAKY